MKASCFSFVNNFRQLSRPTLSSFECSVEQRSDLNTNFLIGFSFCTWLCSKSEQRLFTTYSSGTCKVNFEKEKNILNKFFKMILGKWTICKAEKPVIKFGEKGKRKRKTGKVVKSFSRERKAFALHKRNVNPDFSFSRLCPFINKCSSTIKLYPGLLNLYYQYEKSQKWTHWFNRHNY